MKKITIIFCITLWFSGLTLSLPAQALKLDKAGIKGGINFFNLKGDDVGDPGALIGYQFGGFANFNITSNLNFSPELKFSVNRWEAEENSLTHAVWTYIDVPLLVSLNVSPVQGLFLEGGPQIGLLLKAKVKGETASGTEVDIDRTETLKDLNVGFAVGAGYVLSSGPRFSIRYILGISSVAQDDPDFPDPDVKTNSFQISVGYPILNR